MTTVNNNNKCHMNCASRHTLKNIINNFSTLVDKIEKRGFSEEKKEGYLLGITEFLSLITKPCEEHKNENTTASVES